MCILKQFPLLWSQALLAHERKKGTFNFCDPPGEAAVPVFQTKEGTFYLCPCTGAARPQRGQKVNAPFCSPASTHGGEGLFTRGARNTGGIRHCSGTPARG